MNNLKPNGSRAKTAIILICIVLGLEIISLISGFFQYNLLQNAASGTVISTEEANANDLREQIIGLFYSLAFLVSGITFIMWFRRAYYNLHQKVSSLSYGEGWAAGAWFVPILNWFRPFQIMAELYKHTPEVLLKHNIEIQQKLQKTNLAIWWTLWLSSSILAQVVLQFSRNASTIHELITVTNLEMISNIIGIPLALITLKVVSNYAKMEPLLFEIQDENQEVNTPFHVGSSSTLLDN